MYELDPVLSQAPCCEDVRSCGGAGAQILHESIALPSGRDPLSRRLYGYCEEKDLCPCRGSNRNSPGLHSVAYIITTLTELPWLLCTEQEMYSEQKHGTN